MPPRTTRPATARQAPPGRSAGAVLRRRRSRAEPPSHRSSSSRHIQACRGRPPGMRPAHALAPALANRVPAAGRKTAINDACRAKQDYLKASMVTSVAIAAETIFLQEDNVVLAAKPGFVAHLAMGGTAARAAPVDREHDAGAGRRPAQRSRSTTRGTWGKQP